LKALSEKQGETDRHFAGFEVFTAVTVMGCSPVEFADVSEEPTASIFRVEEE
jgi:hypothetical protein